MGLRFLGTLYLLFCGSLGCHEDLYADSEETESEINTKEKDELEEPSSFDSPPAPQNPSSGEEDEFDACPSDTYVLLEEGGFKYVVKIQVFCEPKPVFNLGCPEPYSY